MTCISRSGGLPSKSIIYSIPSIVRDGMESTWSPMSIPSRTAAHRWKFDLVCHCSEQRDHGLQIDSGPLRAVEKPRKPSRQPSTTATSLFDTEMSPTVAHYRFRLAPWHTGQDNRQLLEASAEVFPRTR